MYTQSIPHVLYSLPCMHPFPILIKVGDSGCIKFGSPYADWSLPSSCDNMTQDYVVCPYWTDMDTPSAGNVSYQVFEHDGPALQSTNDYISNMTDKTFNATWMLLAEWNNVHSSGGGGYMVGIIIITDEFI